MDPPVRGEPCRNGFPRAGADQETTAALASTLAVPHVVPRWVFGAAAPNNPINVAPIGCGYQSQRIVPRYRSREACA
jgi:hypothetical protein